MFTDGMGTVALTWAGEVTDGLGACVSGAPARENPRVAAEASMLFDASTAVALTV